jgi:hypothetical protein
MQRVIEALAEHGVDAVEVEEDDVVAVEWSRDTDGNPDRPELLDEIGSWLAERGLPFVPEEVDGRILIRPPAA